MGLACVPSAGHAANPLTSLELKPSETLIAILDQERKLTGEGNRRLFQAGGFKVAVLDDCLGGDEIACLGKRLPALAEDAGAGHVLLMTSAAHTPTVTALYGHGRSPAVLSGVILFRAQPGAMAKPQAPDGLPALIFAKIEDDKADLLASRRFADRLRRQGVPVWFYTLSDRTPASRVIQIIKHFIGARGARGVDRDFLVAHALWQSEPPFDHAGFRRHDAFIRQYEVDDVFRKTMRDFFFLDEGQLKKWALKRYAAFDFLAYRDADPAARGARYLVLRNRLGQLCVIDLRVYADYEPVIVIGIDDVANLFRLHYFYRTKAGYSWKPDEQPRLSVRPLGAFLHFRKPVPEVLAVRLSIRSKLSFGGMSFAADNPLATLDALTPSLKKVMTLRNDCIYCHQLDGIGGKARHLVAVSGEPQPGFALPLRSYSKEVLNRFFFDQASVAAKIGAIPNPVPPEQAKELYDFLTAGR